VPNADTTVAVVLALVIALASSGLAVIFSGVLAAPKQTRAAGPGTACAEWTDGCVLCVRTPAGPACSTPGIACVRGETRCLKN
jgi:hypothetical protein